ncbi:hypothetical protein JCM14722_30140 [Pseudodesulfovibrio portus]|uniref:Right handed beta helix domain-containing protein n=2 Tax=Pseudodesulfovibrio portus TaxID=231439 RepID=A0ABN6RWQ8_9BACT|nr:hypothetical protein JCM14722_30140 [Pseudodesulfovibrio portus]
MLVVGVALGGVSVANAKPLKPAWSFQADAASGFAKQSRMLIFKDLPEVVLRNVRFHREHLADTADKYSGNFIYVKNCKKVVLDGVVAQWGKGVSSAYQSILIEDCDEVTVTNCFFSGKVKRAHLRIEGCGKVDVSNVEVSGISLDGQVVGSGIGVWINNGSPQALSDPKRGMYSGDPLDLNSFTLRNSYFHDPSIVSDKFQNIDGVLVHSGSNGVIDGCFFENWYGGDAALDLSHRRRDEKYRNKTIQVKNCSFINSKCVKANGISLESNKITFSGNTYINTPLQFYHNGYTVRFLNDVFLYKNQKNRGFFIQLLGMHTGKVRFDSCLMLANAMHSFIAQSGNTKGAGYKGLFSWKTYFVVGSSVRAVSTKVGENVTSLDDIKNGFIFKRSIDSDVKAAIQAGSMRVDQELIEEFGAF